MTYRVTTKREFEADFREAILPAIHEMEKGRIDYPLRREEWNNYIDGLVEEGELPLKARNWQCPW